MSVYLYIVISFVHHTRRMSINIVGVSHVSLVRFSILINSNKSTFDKNYIFILIYRSLVSGWIVIISACGGKMEGERYTRSAHKHTHKHESQTCRSKGKQQEPPKNAILRRFLRFRNDFFNSYKQHLYWLEQQIYTCLCIRVYITSNLYISLGRRMCVIANRYSNTDTGHIYTYVIHIWMCVTAWHTNQT